MSRDEHSVNLDVGMWVKKRSLHVPFAAAFHDHASFASGKYPSD